MRRGNVMARQRMIVLYDRSAAFDALVAGTSNKTEALLGYGTLLWRHGGGHPPIGDLYKSQLREWPSAWACPSEILAKPPSADLWPGQTDEAELGATYDDLDRILFALVDRRWSAGPLRGAPASTRRWSPGSRGAVARMEFKRQLPPVAKVSLRTPGIDHLYPRRRPGSRRQQPVTRRGRLLVVGTPIGNLGDLTPARRRRAADADLVVAEDTRLAARLLAHLGARSADAVLQRRTTPLAAWPSCWHGWQPARRWR